MLLKVGLTWMSVILMTVCCHASSSRQKRIVGGHSAMEPQESVGLGFGPPSSQETETSVVNVQDDYRSATITGTEEPEGYRAYKGIRYAEPPVENLRFQRPVLVHPSGKIDATKYGPPCLQQSVDNSGVVGSEDCLFLNVFTPMKRANNTNLSVMFWIHGGGFSSGSAQQYGPAHLVKNNLIVVTIQYRLGTLGWLTSNIKHLPGNVGLFDMRAALKWVNKYISYFNGDPERIVLAGQGSGASAATFLSISDLATGTMNGVIAMSGGPLSGFAMDPEPKNTYVNMTELLGCGQSTTLDAVRCLQEISAQKIINCDHKFQNTKLFQEGFLSGIGSLLNAGPIIDGSNDGRFLPLFFHDSPLNLMKTNKLPAIPMITGVNKLETKTEVLGKFRNQVLDKLNKIPNYIQKVLTKDMLGINTGLFANGKVNNALKTLFENNDYTKLVTSFHEKGANEIAQVVQSTTDALFNLPAFFTSHLWSKRSSAYFYSFEHKPSIKNPGKLFLPNIKDTTNNKETHKGSSNDVEDKGEPGHGDELIYLYDVRSLEGKPVAGTELKDKKDIEMRNNFTSLVAEFVQNGKPKLPKLGDEWPSFTSSKQSEYVVLDGNSRIEKKFRFCEMGLWGGISDILQSSYCNLPGITDILKTVPDLLQNGVLSQVNLLESRLNNIGQLLKNTNGNHGGLLSGVGSNNNLLSGIGSSNGQQGLMSGVGSNNNLLSGIGSSNGQQGLMSGVGNNNNNKNNQLVGVLTGHISDIKKPTLLTPVTSTVETVPGSKLENKKPILNIQRPFGLIGK